MNEWEEYPLKQCESCLHNMVCKFIDMFSTPDLPINLDEVTCDEYIGENNKFSLDNMPITENRIHQFDVPGDMLEDDSDGLLMVDGLEDEYVTEFLQAIGLQFMSFRDKGANVKLIILNKDDVKRMQEAWNTDESIAYLQMVDGTTVDVQVSDDVPVGMVMYEFYK